MLTETKILYFDLISTAFYMLKNGAQFWDMKIGIRYVATATSTSTTSGDCLETLNVFLSMASNL